MVSLDLSSLGLLHSTNSRLSSGSFQTSSIAISQLQSNVFQIKFFSIVIPTLQYVLHSGAKLYGRLTQ